MDAGASASARPAGLPVHDARPVGCAHPASRARPAGAASHSRKGAGRGLDRPLAASAAGPRPAITARRPVNSLKDRGRRLRGTEKNERYDRGDVELHHSLHGTAVRDGGNPPDRGESWPGNVRRPLRATCS